MSRDRKIFISYARDDGEKAATELCERLKREEPDLKVWLDRFKMTAGTNWKKQITDAIDESEYLVLVMTPGAMTSKFVRDEWLYARKQGVCVCPVIGAEPADLDFKSLPKWMSKAHCHNLEKEWEAFINRLKSPCQALRVPHMAPLPPQWFVQRPDQYGKILECLLNHEDRSPITLTTALHAAGGWGKTTLAEAVCHDDRVISAFDDGILWVTLGERPNITGALIKLYAAVTGERPAFVDEQDAVTELSDRLRGRDYLIVVDDVWDILHLEPFRRAGKDCAVLVTTRKANVAAEGKAIKVDEMTTNQASEMLVIWLERKPDDLAPFRSLSARMGEWPILVKLARDVLRRRVAQGETLERALRYLNTALDKKGVFAFDRRDTKARDQAVANTVDVSLEFLTAEECTLYFQLGVFEEDIDIPFAVIGDLWGKDEFDTEELLLRMYDLSLILKLDLETRTIRLHDVMRNYLIQQAGDVPALHGKLADAWGDCLNLPHDYAWRWLAYHLKEAGRKDELRKLLLDFRWLKAKLEATDIAELTRDYNFLPDDEILRLIQQALRLSAHIIGPDKGQLVEHLHARLVGFDQPEIKQMLAAAATSKSVWLRPYVATMNPPGCGEIRTLSGHTHHVKSVAVTSDGRLALSGSQDCTVKVWDLESGREVWTLSGHTHHVNSVAITSDGRLALSGSSDHTVKVWEVQSGRELQTLSGHTNQVNSVAITSGGRLALSGSDDYTVKVWDLETGEELRTLSGHTSWVNSVAVTSDGRRALSGSNDNTVKVWDLETGWELRTLSSHKNEVNSVAVTSNGRLALSGSSDNTVKVWDLETGRELRTLSGHMGQVTSVAMTSDGRLALSGSGDKTVKVWDLESGREVRTLSGHTGYVLSVAVTSDGRLALSGSINNTVKVWYLQCG